MAIAFTGFASLVGIFGRRSTRDDPRVDANRLRTMLTCSLSVVALCLVPFVPLRYGLSEPASWRLSSAVLLAVVTGLSARTALDYRVVRAARLRVSRAVVVINSVLLLLPLGLGLLNVAGASDRLAPTHYLVCLLALLALAGLMFARLIGSFLLAPPPP